MSERLCPACRKPVANNISSSGECMSCGHDLVATAPPPGWQRSGMDLRRVAKWQRTLLWLVLALVVLNGLAFFLAATTPAPQGIVLVLVVLTFALQIAGLVTVLMMLDALGIGIAVRIIYAFLMLAPCLSLLALLSANSQATNALRYAGIKVGFMGASDRNVVSVLGGNQCSACGYLLVGNVSGACPECGAALQR